MRTLIRQSLGDTTEPRNHWITYIPNKMREDLRTPKSVGLERRGYNPTVSFRPSVLHPRVVSNLSTRSEYTFPFPTDRPTVSVSNVNEVLYGPGTTLSIRLPCNHPLFLDPYSGSIQVPKVSHFLEVSEETLERYLPLESSVKNRSHLDRGR